MAGTPAPLLTPYVVYVVYISQTIYHFNVTLNFYYTFGNVLFDLLVLWDRCANFIMYQLYIFFLFKFINLGKSSMIVLEEIFLTS